MPAGDRSGTRSYSVESISGTDPPVGIERLAGNIHPRGQEEWAFGDSSEGGSGDISATS